MKPVLKYRGGKLRDIPDFIAHVPQNYQRYFEPFLGGGAVFFHLEPQNAVIGDVNGRLINFYTQLRNQYPTMRKQLDNLQREYEDNQAAYEALRSQHPGEFCENRNEAMYYRLREQFNHPTGEYLDGTLYFFINKTAYSGMLRYNSSGEYNVPYGRYRHFNTGVITEEHSRLCSIRITCRCFNRRGRGISCSWTLPTTVSSMTTGTGNCPTDSMRTHTAGWHRIFEI